MGTLQDLNDATAAGFAAVGDAYYNIRQRVLRLEDFGAVGNNADADTAALQAVANMSNVVIHPYPGRVYYIKTGVSLGNNVYFAGHFIFKLKMGAGGFASVDNGAATRYDTTQVLLRWLNVEGGGFNSIEVYGDLLPGLGGDYAVIPVVVQGGMTTTPFRGGDVYLHDLTLLTGGVTFNSLTVNGANLRSLRVENCGTAKGNTWWKTNGVAAPSINPTGLALGDFSGVQAPFNFGPLICRGLALTGQARADYSEETDFVTLGGVGSNTGGGEIAYIDGYNVGEVLDCQMSNVRIPGGVRGDTCLTAVKFVHGASHNRIGGVQAFNTSIAAVGFYGSNEASFDTANNDVGLVTGASVCELAQASGTLVSATSTTAVLPGSTSSINNYYRGLIRITGGTGAGQELPFSSYTGASRTINLTGSWGVTPNATSTFAIFYSDNRQTVLLAGEGTRKPTQNSGRIGAVVNGGLRKYDLYSGLATATLNNRFTLDVDSGGTVQSTMCSTFGTTRLVPGDALKSSTRLGNPSAQTVTDATGSGVTVDVNFATALADSYARTGVTNPQSSTTEKGIRALVPGSKNIKVGIGFGSGANAPINGDYFQVQLLRNGTLIATTWMRQGVATLDDTTLALSFDIYHRDDWFGGNQNLYTVKLLFIRPATGSVQISNDSTKTYFSVSG